MGVKVRKRNGRWYVVIDYCGRRKSKCVGAREAAERVKREVGARLALGDLGVLEQATAPPFAAYAERWMTSDVRPHLKPSTVESYEVILRVHLLPKLGILGLDPIKRNDVKSFLAELIAHGKLARNTVKNIFAIPRALFSQAAKIGL